VRTFDRDDGSEGRVSNLVLGDETGRIRVTLWDEMTEAVEEVSEGDSVEVVDGYTRERDGDLELHLNDRSAVKPLEEDVSYVPDVDEIADLELGGTADIAGVVRSADPKRTFDRDDGSEGQVRNVRVQDGTGDIRVALWGEKADRDLQPGDEALFTDVEIQEGWQDDLEASAGWRSTVSLLDGTATDVEAAAGGAGTDTNTGPDTGSGSGGDDGTLGAFADSGGSGGGSGSGAEAGASSGTDDGSDPDDGAESGVREFTGTVVQTGEPVMLDDGSETMTVRTDADLRLGQEVTVRGELRDGTLHVEELF
jgi:replication factor A1